MPELYHHTSGKKVLVRCVISMALPPGHPPRHPNIASIPAHGPPVNRGSHQTPKRIRTSMARYEQFYKAVLITPLTPV